MPDLTNHTKGGKPNWLQEPSGTYHLKGQLHQGQANFLLTAAWQGRWSDGLVTSTTVLCKALGSHHHEQLRRTLLLLGCSP